MTTKSLETNNKVIDFFIKAIQEGKYQENSPIPTEAELASKFNMSRGSVREALKILQFIGILTSSQGSGYRVTSNLNHAFSSVIRLLLGMKLFTFRDISTFREALDIKSLMLIQNTSVSQEDIDYLYQCIDSMRDREQAYMADIRFHKKIARMSGNSLIISMIDSLSELTKEYILIPWADITAESAEELITAHEDIVKALGCKTTILGPNPITRHYIIADQIHNNKHSLDEPAFSLDASINDLLSQGYTPEQLAQRLMSMKNDKLPSNAQ